MQILGELFFCQSRT